MNRRAFMVVAGSGVLTGIAGCKEFQESTDTTEPARSGDHEGEAGHHAKGAADSGHDDKGGSHNDGEGSHDDGGGHQNHERALDGPVEHAEVTAVTEDGHHFLPHLVWVKSGGTVTWTNESGAHSVTSYHAANGKSGRVPENTPAWDSGTLTDGEQFEQTFDTAGVYDYFCRPHGVAGMVGSVLVGHPDPHEQPGLEEPADDLPDAAARILTSLNERVNKALGHEH